MKNSKQLGKKPAPPLVSLLPVTPPYYARLGKKVSGMPREHVDEAFEDARALGVGAIVVSSEGTVLARWINATSARWW